MAPADSDADRIVVFTPIGRDGPASAELLGRIGLRVGLCADFQDLIAKAEAGAAALFIAEEGLFGKDLSPLRALVKNQPPWSDLPFVILTSRQDDPAIVAWRQRLTGLLGNVSLLERPLQAISLTSTMQAALRARQRQYEVRTLLDARERAAHGLETLVVARTQALQDANRELRAQISERARVEEALRQAQKIEAVGQLTGGVSHDFNNLLMVIIGGLDMLERNPNELRRQQIVDGMRKAALRGASLTRQLLAFSRRQPLHPEVVDLRRLVGSMRDLLDRSLRGDVHVELDFADELWPVEVDPGELELVILNLAVNARDAMPAGGTITIRAENVASNDNVPVKSDSVTLALIDTGSGMSQKVLDRVFEPFFTTKEVGKGSGLGLPQVYGFAKQSGGSVSIESETGKGTCVTLHLPRSAKTPVAEPEQPLDLRAGHARANFKGRILLVEDDDEVAELVTEMLDQLGYDVMRVASAKAALGALANDRGVDIVFSDIMMPGGMNGLDLVREIRARRRHLPVLLTSGYSEATKGHAEAEGIRILPKPYCLDDLATALRATMGDQKAWVLSHGRAT